MPVFGGALLLSALPISIKHRLLSVAVFVAVLLLILSTLAANDRLWRTEQARLLHDRALSVSHEIERHVLQALDAATVLGTLVHQNGGAPSRFEEDALDLLDIFNCVTNLQLAPNGVIQAIYPLDGHEAAIGLNILRHDRSRTEAWIAVNTRSRMLSGPIELVQGGQGMLARQPVFLPDSEGNDQFWGFASALLHLDTLLNEGRLDQLAEQGFDYRLLQRDPVSGEWKQFAGSPAPLADAETLEIPIPNRSWKLEMAWHTPPTLAPFTLVQGALGLILAWLAASYTAHRSRFGIRLQSQLATQNLHNQQLQTSLTHERDRAKAYLDNLAGTLLLVTDSVGRVRLLNRHGYQLLGYAESSLNGRLWSELCNPLDNADPFHLQIGASGDEPPLSFEATLLCADGRILFTRWHGSQLSCSEQTELLFVGEDITSQRAHQQDLLKLSQAVEQSSASVVMLHRRGHIEYVNSSFTRLTGFRPSEVIGRKPHFLECEATDTATLIHLRREVARGNVWQGEICYRRKDGSQFWARENIAPITNENGEITHFVSVLDDISAQREQQQAIEHLAYFDQLTGLANRRRFRQRLDAMLEDESKQPLALLHIDLDHFKRINELLGHDAGDQLLRRVADKLRHETRAPDQVARISGDEFFIALPNTEPSTAYALARRLLRELRQPTWLGSNGVRSHEMLISASIGIACHPLHSHDATELIQFADLATHHAKREGGNSYRHFSRSMAEQQATNLMLEHELHQALKEKQFVLYYQPQIDLPSGRVCGIEALIRWQHPSRGLVFPDQFIPVAEEAGLIVAIGQQVLQMAFATQKRLTQNGLGHLRMAVNLSALQFRDPLFISSIRQLLEENRTPATQIELELTESMLMSNINDAIEQMTQLKSLGLTLAIDDFGTGYSSLSYLKKLPVDVLKVDRSFVKDIPHGANDMAITAAVIAMARKLNMTVVAEGVEEPEQRDFLIRNGCQTAQGYYYSAPVAESELMNRITEIEYREQTKMERQVAIQPA